MHCDCGNFRGVSASRCAAPQAPALPDCPAGEAVPMLSRMLIRLARWLLILLALAGIAAAVIPAIPGNIWWVRYLDFPRIEILIASAVVWVLLLLVSRGRASRLALLVLAGAIAWQA